MNFACFLPGRILNQHVAYACDVGTISGYFSRVGCGFLSGIFSYGSFRLLQLSAAIFNSVLFSCDFFLCPKYKLMSCDQLEETGLQRLFDSFLVVLVLNSVCDWRMIIQHKQYP